MSGIMLMMVGGKGGDAPANTVAPALSDSTPVYNQAISTTTGTWTSDYYANFCVSVATKLREYKRGNEQ